ncbi:hypothetical protein BWI93_15845 [Siphonobacter sp. BAB-5385]|uniref:Uncharacterized protein n=2 Tax=Siphonobacter TaxID=700450 RepID=A0A2S7IT36_9BACT|nr:hypothetical protein [Siphonobacter curvatus]OZI07221.1 hypothetical protein BWI93_15845 [Siphonobacter sp. BAB-5385]PQA60864.1 hypothetical protein C5O19_14990 [Siphonobacter curvatus]
MKMMSTVGEIKKELSRQLRDEQGFLGLAIRRENEKEYILVRVKSLTKHWERRVPEEIDGVRIKLEKGEPAHAYVLK